MSPTWESIDIKRQIFLILCSIHSVTAYEVRLGQSTCSDNARCHVQNVVTHLHFAAEEIVPDHNLHCLLQLPIYIPSDEERRDPLLYAQNVRQYMVSSCRHQQKQSRDNGMYSDA